MQWTNQCQRQIKSFRTSSSAGSHWLRLTRPQIQSRRNRCYHYATNSTKSKLRREEGRESRSGRTQWNISARTYKKIHTLFQASHTHKRRSDEEDIGRAASSRRTLGSAHHSARDHHQGDRRQTESTYPGLYMRTMRLRNLPACSIQAIYTYASLPVRGMQGQ